MYTFITVILIITCILLALVVLVQNSKGGGLASGFSSSNQVMGVRRTTDLLEKLTWGLAIALMVFSISGTMVMPRSAENQASSVVQEQIDAAVPPSTGAPQPLPSTQPDPGTATTPVENIPDPAAE